MVVVIWTAMFPPTVGMLSETTLQWLDQQRSIYRDRGLQLVDGGDYNYDESYSGVGRSSTAGNISLEQRGKLQAVGVLL